MVEAIVVAEDIPKADGDVHHPQDGDERDRTRVLLDTFPSLLKKWSDGPVTSHDFFKSVLDLSDVGSDVCIFPIRQVRIIKYCESNPRISYVFLRGEAGLGRRLDVSRSLGSREDSAFEKWEVRTVRPPIPSLEHVALRWTLGEQKQKDVGGGGGSGRRRGNEGDL